MTEDLTMPTNPTPGGEPAEGSRETIDHELERTRRPPRRAERGSKPAPGDEAAPGTPGTGEDLCPARVGRGALGARPCPNCNGSGRIIKGIGGA